MRRRCRSILVGLSLAIFVLTIVTWVRSHWRSDWIGLVRETIRDDVGRYGQLGVSWGEGQLRMGYSGSRALPLVEGQSLSSLPGVPPQPYANTRWGWYRTVPWGSPATLGFSATAHWNRPIPGVSNVRAFESEIGLILPHWFVALASAALPAWCFYKHPARLRRYRREHNLCLACGYDLRGSPDRCPECGQVSAAS